MTSSSPRPTRRFCKEEIIPRINAFLPPRGVALSEQKTKVTQITQGFDFLGQSIRKFERRGQLGKIPITPSQSSLAAIKAKVKAICKAPGGLTQAQLIDNLNPVLRGWANYHRHVICAETFSKLDTHVWGGCSDGRGDATRIRPGDGLPSDTSAHRMATNGPSRTRHPAAP